VFSKPKEQKENSKAETSGEHRGGSTTTSSYSPESPRRGHKRKDEVRRVKREKRGGGRCAEKTERRQVRQPDGTVAIDEY
jgi:hypothetical protein